MRRICAQRGCTVAAGRVRCQDCGKAFCGEHIGAVDFSGPRERGARPTEWTRYVCAECARRAVRKTTEATADAAHVQARRDAQVSWWDER
jgi:hypothetical protein